MVFALFSGKTQHVQKVNAILLPDMEKALKLLQNIIKNFPALSGNPYMFGVRGAKRGYVHGNKTLEFVCHDLKMRRVITAAMTRRLFATKAVFGENPINKRL